MNQEWINQKIKESYENEVEKWFYGCDCVNGNICIDTGSNDLNSKWIKCTKCNGTGIYRNIDKLLMLIITKLSKAVKAYGENKFSDFENYLNFKNKAGNTVESFKEAYEKYIKDTFENELANTFIRLFYLCGYLKIGNILIDTFQYLKKDICLPKVDNVFESILSICSAVCMANEENEIKRNAGIVTLFTALYYFCKALNIDIKKHIDLKMEYNKTRPHKHGKE